jgi:uncharacterized membrane protein
VAETPAEIDEEVAKMKVKNRLKWWQILLFVAVIIIIGAILLAVRLQMGVNVPLFS